MPSRKDFGFLLCVLTAVALIATFRFRPQVSEQNIKCVFMLQSGNPKIKEKKEAKCNIARDATRGHWIEKPGLTRYEKEERKRLDRLIREQMDWPVDMYRNDSRCGKQFPVPGYRIQGQCDPESTVPCCNQATGWCGNDSTHCTCAQCTDLRHMISAELAEWVPTPPCELKSYSSQDSCTWMNRNVKSLTFMGDSLIRQLHTTSLLYFTGNVYSGAVPKNATLDVYELCQGEFQITNKVCSVEKMAHSSREIDQFCGNNASFQVDLVQDYHRDLIGPVKEKLEQLVDKIGAWVVMGVGLHYQLDFDDFREKYLDKVTKILDTSRNGWPRVIWIGIHGIFGFLRMNTGPANDRITTFNDKVNDYLSRRNISLIETFEMSRNVKSYDGRHYGLAFNMLKLRVVLNAMRQLTEESMAENKQ